MTEAFGTARTGRWVLAAAIAGAALAVGTVHTVTLCVVTAGLAVALSLTWWNAERTTFRPRVAATVLLVTGATLTAYTALQTIPMPIGWLGAIAPRNADGWSRALTPLHETGPRWAPISLDPTATRIEVLKGIAYLLAFVTALRIARTRDGISFLSTAIVITGAVLAAAALLHPAFGAHKLYGIWSPSAEVLVHDKHVAPFLNPNNLAAYLNVAFCLALAATLSPEPHWPRPLVAAAAILLASTQVWVGSRGGVGSMALGAALVVVLSRVSRMAHQAGRRGAIVSVAVALAIAAGVLMIVFATSQQTSDELFETDLTKLGLFRQAARMLPAYPIFGVGRGAFESAFPLFRDTPGIVTFTHPENVVLQWSIEWGVPIGLAGLAAVGFALRPSTVLARSSTAAGAWAGLVSVAVQNLVDLGSEVPGLVLAPTICAAIVVGGTAGRSTRWSAERWGQSPGRLVIAAVLATVVGAGGAAVGMGKELREDRGALLGAATSPNESATSPGAMHSLARTAMLRHPVEAYLPFVVGWRAARVRDDDPMPWIEATLERTAVYAPAHLVLARLLVARSPSQARLEYRTAIEQAPELAWQLSPETTRLVRMYDDAIEIVPAGKTAPATLETLSEALVARLPATSVRLDDLLASLAPSVPGPALRAAKNAVNDLEAAESAPWCEGALRKGCVARALDATGRAEAVTPTACEPYLLRARAQMAALDPRTALSDLATAAEGVADRVECLEALVDLATLAHDDARASDAMAKIASAGCTDDADCAANLGWVAAAEERVGDGRRALVFYKRAYDRSPDNDGLLESVARLAASSGLHTEAHSDYERLARRHPGDARWRVAAEAERDAALKAASSL